ncbi:MAG: tol-pal system-associated acyl-CoA thioesterase [Azospirillum brasilense]|nr:MAG: tol-pal system-associated acyl-CoA thioesterase [Azospirillum brasilense]
MQDHAFFLPIRVYYEDTDAGGIVYHSNYLNFCERARTEWLRHLGNGRDWLREEFGLIFVVRRASIDWRKPARLDDLLLVETRMTKLGRVRMHMDQTITRDGVVLATVQIELVCIDHAKFAPVELPESLLAHLPPLPRDLTR